MLSRSASGPGGLSINTGSANLFGSTPSQQPPAAGGLFGRTTSNAGQPAQSGGLFGAAPASTQAQATGGLFGNASTTSSQQQTSGLFGSATQSQPQQTGGLFGSTMAQPQQQTGGLFGSTATSQPQQSGGLFGSLGTQPQQQQQQQQQQQTGGLFGSSAAQSQQQQPGTGTGTGLFGASASQPQQQTGGLFGNKPAQTTSSGLFGQSKPAGGLFGQSTAQPQSSAFGQSALGPGLTMGQSTSNQQSQGQQQVVPGVRIDLSNIRSTTRFNDLQEDLQKQIAEVDKFIQGFINHKNELDAFMPAHGDQLSSIPTDVAFVSRKAAGVEAALAADAVAVKQLRELVKVDANNAKLSFKAIDNLKLPTPYHQAGLWSTRGQQASATGASADVDGEGSSDLVSFFSRTADEMGETMKKLERNLGEIETHLHGVQANVLEQLQRVAATPKDGVQGSTDEQIVELAAVLRDFEETILKVASSVGGAREGVTQLQLGEFLGNGANGVH